MGPGCTGDERHCLVKLLFLLGCDGLFQPPSVAAAPTSRLEVTTKWVTQSSLDQLSVLDVTSNSAHLSWAVPIGNFDSFLIQYKDAEGRPQSLPVDGASRTLTIPNLEPSQRYKFNLYGVSGGKRLGPLSVEAVTGQQWINGLFLACLSSHFQLLSSLQGAAAAAEVMS